MLSDTQQHIRTRSERTFNHLQRLLVVDEEVRNKWKAAYEKGEIECEKLGAVHLLLHGIWAFKVDAEGERTDLVYQEPTGDLKEELRYADGIVLTEWKKAKPELSENNLSILYQQARDQAKRYASGALGGCELTAYRFLVVVSEKQVNVPDVKTVNGIVYHHVNIAIDPSSPSRRLSKQR